MLYNKYIYTNDLSTYDPYDIWKTKMGFIVKKQYYSSKIVGAVPAVALTILDNFNDSFKLFYSKQEYPIVRAYAALIALNQYEQDMSLKALKYAKVHLEWLKSNTSSFSPNASWGVNFKLTINESLEYSSNTGYSTITPYVLEAFIKYTQLTEDKQYVYVIESIYNFIDNDLKVMYSSENEEARSYGPLKDRIVTNSNSYTMYSYALMLNYIPDTHYIEEKITKLYNFILKQQKEDGSWLYEPLSKNSFIDCFHTCFIIKNLIKTTKLFNLPEVNQVIESGYNYLLNNFYDPKIKLMRRFSMENKPSFIKWDLYDNAEMLNLFNLLNKEELFDELNTSIKKNFIKESNIYSQINIIGNKKKSDTLRWAVMPYIYALSNKNAKKV